ncbi:uncharacterized protein M6B38_101805 [Iris pallida]|uniref:MORF/ORRM1/DAG-like MORF domain-containing protein n=1 Tax=Iris pallida TaxID=29817 RepID=A0AAX6ILQ8_IRIPA|nr:Uncharacterized protein M6B38_246035 [Iris pallida]KAJ6854192.1 uncharacterized protein M6B38_101805 [Iris pallida]
MALAAMTRSILSSSSAAAASTRTALPLLLSRRLLSYSGPTALSRFRPAVLSASSILPVRFGQVRCRVNRAGGDSAYSPLKSGSGYSDRPPTEMAPLFPGCDYNHWLIVMDKPGGEGAGKQQMIDCYVQTLAKVLGSEEEAKKKIYNVSCERYFGFGCEIDEETSNKLEGLPGVLFVLPDSYVDAENKDYGVLAIYSENADSLWKARSVLDECRELLLCNNGISFSYTPRKCNGAAHALAPFTLLSTFSVTVNYDIVPLCISDHIKIDMVCLDSFT